jgi:hypothetical protein
MELKRYISLLALVVIIALQYGIDSFIDFQRLRASREQTFEQYLIFAVASHVILLFLWLALYWFTLIWGQPNSTMGVIFLIVGFVIVIYPVIELYTNRIPFLFNSPNTSLQYTGVFTAFLGVLLLLKPKQRYSSPS